MHFTYRNQSTAMRSPIFSMGRLTACRTIIVVTFPADGIPAAPIETAVAVTLKDPNKNINKWTRMWRFKKEYNPGNGCLGYPGDNKRITHPLGCLGYMGTAKVYPFPWVSWRLWVEKAAPIGPGCLETVKLYSSPWISWVPGDNKSSTHLLWYLGSLGTTKGHPTPWVSWESGDSKAILISFGVLHVWG